MHVYFREYAQQMGMQNVRTILPEQIDICINTSIIDTVNRLIRENVGFKNDKVILDNSKIGNVNALRPLIGIDEIALNNPMITNFGRLSIDNDAFFNVSINNNYLYVVDFKVNFAINTSMGYEEGAGGDINVHEPDVVFTNFKPVRIIEDQYIAETQNDFVLKSRVTSPIIVLHDDNFDFYVDKFVKGNRGYYFNGSFIVYKLLMNYIKRPDTVTYYQGRGGSVSCNLPEYLHVDIVKQAVDLYHASLQTNAMSAIASNKSLIQNSRTNS